MSDIRFNQWLHNSGTGGISQDSVGHVGIGTTVPTHINALTNNNSILHVGIVSCNTLNAASKIEGAIDDWIIHQSDTNTKFGFPTTNTFTVETAGSERFRIDSSGNVTIGKDGDSGSGPSAGYDELVIEGGNENIGMCFLSPSANNVTQQISFGDSNNNQSGRIIYNHASDYMSLGVGGGADNERLRIDSSGRTLIGHTANLSEGCLLQVARANDNTVELFGYSANANGARVNFTKSRNATIGTNTIVHDGDTIGELHFRAANGSGYFRVAEIAAEMDGVVGVSSLPGRLIFSTTAPGATTQTERLRISSIGQVTKPHHCSFNYGGNSDLNVSSGDTLASWRNNGTQCYERGTKADGGSYLSSGVFTAPVTGGYFFTSTILLKGVTNSTDSVHVYWCKNNTGVHHYFNTRFAGETGQGTGMGYGGYVPVIGACTMYMSAGDTCRIKISYSGSGIGQYAPQNDGWTNWSGFLIG